MNTCRICWKEIWKTYSDKKLRCSSCRKSVENAIWYNERTVEYVEDELFAWKSEYKKLKKENKELKEHKENLIRADKKKSDHIDELEKEIDELKRCRSIEIETCNRYREKCDGLEKENKKLKEENEKLKYNNKLYKEMID